MNTCNDFLPYCQFFQSGKKIVWDYPQNDESDLYRLFESDIKTMDRTYM